MTKYNTPSWSDGKDYIQLDDVDFSTLNRVEPGSSVPFQQTIPHARHTCITMLSSGLSRSSLDACGRPLDAGDPRGAGDDAGNHKGSHRREKPLGLLQCICAMGENVATELTPGFEWSRRIIILEAFSLADGL